MERGIETSSATRARPVRLADLREAGGITFDLAPDAASRSEIAGMLGVETIRKLRFAGTLRPSGRRDWQLKAKLGATAVQSCVVTLEPVVSRIDESVARSYVAGFPEPEPGETEMPPDDDIEPLPESVDLRQVMIEALALALPLYPRAEGAKLGREAFADSEGLAVTDETVRPFAGLASLRGGLDSDGN